MPGNYMPSAAELFRFSPELLLMAAGTLLMIFEAITSPKQKRGLPIFAFVALLAAIALAVAGASDPGPAFNRMLQVDGFATFFRVLVMAVGAVTILISTNYLKQAGHEGGEYYSLVLFSIVGQCLMATANELIMIFIGIEVSSIATYVLAGYLRDDKRNNEAALKYFLLGSFATAFLLYGVAWIYGTTGTTNLTEIRRVLLDPQNAPNSILIGVALSILLFVPRAARLRATELTVTAEGLVRERLADDPPATELLIYDFEGEMFFGAAPELDRYFDEITQRTRKEGIHYLVLRVKRTRNPDVVLL